MNLKLVIVLEIYARILYKFVHVKNVVMMMFVEIGLIFLDALCAAHGML